MRENEGKWEEEGSCYCGKVVSYPETPNFWMTLKGLKGEVWSQNPKEN